MNILRESMTKIALSHLTIRVWRQEPELLGPTLTASVDLNNAAEEAACKEDSTALSIARALIKLERVNAVEVLEPFGNGEVLYKDWP